MAKKLGKNRTLPTIREPQPEEHLENEEIEEPEVEAPKTSSHNSPKDTKPSSIPSDWMPDVEELLKNIPEALPQDPSDFKKTSLRYERELYEAIEEIHYLLRLQSGASAPNIQDIINTFIEAGLAIYRFGTRTPIGAFLLKRMYARRARSQRSQSRKMTGPRT